MDNVSALYFIGRQAQKTAFIYALYNNVRVNVNNAT